MTEPEPDFLVAARTFYDTVAEDYAERFRTELESKPLDRAMLAAFAEFVKADVANDADAGSTDEADDASSTRSANLADDAAEARSADSTRTDTNTSPAGPVAEIGSGPGTVTAHLNSLGLDAFGIDLSPRMVALARRTYPGLRFIEGSMTDLPLDDGSLRGLVPWYSTIHIPQQQLPGVFAEFRRVLAPGGHLLLAFQVGDEPLRLTEAFGHQVSLDFHRRSPDRVADLLADAGFDVQCRLVREPRAGIERSQQAYLLARKPKPVEISN